MAELSKAFLDLKYEMDILGLTPQRQLALPGNALSQRSGWLAPDSTSWSTLTHFGTRPGLLTGAVAWGWAARGTSSSPSASFDWCASSRGQQRGG